MSKIARAMQQAAAGVAKTVEANLGMAYGLNQDYDTDASAVCRVGTTNYYAMVQYDTSSKVGRIYVIEYIPSTGQFISRSNNAAWNGWSTDAYAGIVQDPSTGRVLAIAQTATYYPSIYSFTVNTSNGTISNTNNHQLTSNSNDGWMQDSRMMIVANGGVTVLMHQLNNNFYTSRLSVSSSGINSANFTSWGSANSASRSRTVSLVYSDMIDRYYFFFTNGSCNTVLWGTFSESGGSFNDQDGGSLDGTIDTNCQGIPSVVLPLPNGDDRILIGYEKTYGYLSPPVDANCYQMRFKHLTPYLGGANSGQLTVNQTKDFNFTNFSTGWAASDSIYYLDYEPVSKSPIIGEADGSIYQVLVDKTTKQLPSSMDDAFLYMGYTNGGQYMQGARCHQNIAPYNDEFSVFITGGYNFNQGRVINGQYEP